MASIPTQEEVLAATRKGQEAMMAAVKTWLETVRTATPKLPQVGLPFADRLPTPQDAVANAYHLAEQLLASQRRFAEELVKATAPLRPGYRESSPEVPSPSAWQDAVTEPKAPAVVAPPKAVPSPAPKAAPKAAESTAPKTAPSPAPKAAESAAPKTAPSPAPKAAESAAPKTAPSAAPKAAPARAAAKSTPVRTAPRTTAAKPTTAGSASATAASSRKSTTGTGARKNAGTTTPAPKGTGKS